MTTKSTDDNRQNGDDSSDAVNLAHAKRNEAFQLRENANDDSTILTQALCAFREAAHSFQCAGDFQSAMEMFDNAAQLTNGDGQFLEVRYDQVASLVRIVQGSGCHESFRQLVEFYEIHVCRICWLFLGKNEDVEDAMSEIFHKVFKSIRAGKCHYPDRFTLWLTKLARNHCRDKLRGREPIPTEPFSDFEITVEESDGPGRTHILALVNEIVGSAEQYTAICLWAEGMSYQSIADEMSRTVTSVTGLVNRARKALKEYGDRFADRNER